MSHSLFDDPNELQLLDEVEKARARMLAEGGGKLSADEAGSIVHAHAGLHGRDERCVGCARAGRQVLERLGGFATRPSGGSPA